MDVGDRESTSNQNLLSRPESPAAKTASLVDARDFVFAIRAKVIYSLLF